MYHCTGTYQVQYIVWAAHGGKESCPKTADKDIKNCTVARLLVTRLELKPKGVQSMHEAISLTEGQIVVRATFVRPSLHGIREY